MFAVVGRSSVRPPAPPRGTWDSPAPPHPGLGYEESEAMKAHMHNMLKELPWDIRGRVSSSMFTGAGMAWDIGNADISFAEYIDPRDNSRAYLILHGHFENEDEMRELYDLPQAGPVEDCQFSSTSAELFLSLYLKGFMDAYGDQTSQPETCLDALRGVWSVVLFDELNLYVLAARDVASHAPLFWGSATTGAMLFASDMRLLTHECQGVGMGAAAEFPAGSFFESEPSYEDGHVSSYVKHGKQMKAVPKVDSHGQLCGVMFRVNSGTDMGAMARISSQSDVTAQ